NALAIEKGPPIVVCTGFHISTKDGNQFKNNDEVEIVLTKGSMMSEVKGIDLVTIGIGKFVKNLWEDNKEFSVNGKASLKVKVEVPKRFESQLPTSFMFRSWGLAFDATCFSIREYVTIDK
ncbi:8287_t:CDS:2, partial [Funneliformis mosseae]